MFFSKNKFFVKTITKQKTYIQAKRQLNKIQQGGYSIKMEKKKNLILIK